MKQTMTKADLWNGDRYKERRVLNVGSGTESYGDERIDLYPTPTTTKVWDIENGLPYQDESWDEVYSRYSFEHLRNPGWFVSEACRVLAPGGRLYILTNNAWFWRGSWKLATDGRGALEHSHGPHDQHYALYLPEHLLMYLHHAGFVRIEIGFTGWTRKIDKMLKVMMLGHMSAQNVYAEGFKPERLETVPI